MLLAVLVECRQIAVGRGVFDRNDNAGILTSGKIV